jgi:hypothetical protein
MANLLVFLLTTSFYHACSSPHFHSSITIVLLSQRVQYVIKDLLYQMVATQDQVVRVRVSPSTQTIIDIVETRKVTPLLPRPMSHLSSLQNPKSRTQSPDLSDRQISSLPTLTNSTLSRLEMQLESLFRNGSPTGMISEPPRCKRRLNPTLDGWPR